MKVLMITADFPPIGGSHMQRMLNFANSLIDAGLDVYVLGCIPIEGHPCVDYASTEFVDKRIHVYYTPEGFIHRKVHSMKVKKTNHNKNIDNKRLGIKKRLMLFVKSYKNKFFIPDTMIDWYFTALKYINNNNLIEKIQPDVIISCSMPNSSHLLGYRVAKKYNIRLIMDYADPWVYETSLKRGKLRFNFEYRLEKKILNYASHVCFATEETKKLYMNNYCLKSNDVSVAMMGFYKNNQYSDRLNNDYDKSYLKISYGGALNPAHRNPIHMFKALKKLENQIRVKLYLRVDETNRINRMVEELNASNIFVNEYVPFDDYMVEANSCDILVIFGNSSKTQISGKLFNYMSTGLRILYIKNMKREMYDPTEEILKKYGNTTFVQNDVDEIVEIVNKIYEEKNNGMLVRLIDSNIKEYSWENQGSIFSAAVKKVIKDNY